MKLLLSVLLLTTLTWQVLAVAQNSCPSNPPQSCPSNAAPCDQVARCVTDDPQYRHTYPCNWRVLMDSINYLELIDDRDGVWQRLDVDGTGTTWQQAGGICGHEVSVCEIDYFNPRPTKKNNWFFTQYINYLDAREVFVNVTHDFTGCCCGCQSQVTFYRYERDEPNAAAARDPNNYSQVRNGSVTDRSGFGLITGNRNFSFQPSSNSHGFYIGVQDTGSCVSIRRLTIYYRICPGRTEGVTVIPEIPLPPEGSDNCTTKQACCRPNAINVTSLEVKCCANGTRIGNPRCVCSRGYEFVPATAFCRACPPDTYQARDSNDFSCQPCPANSETRNQATAVCECDCGFGRPPDDPDAPCTPITTPAPGVPCPTCPTSPTCPTPPTDPPSGRPSSPSNVQIRDGVVVWDRPSNTGNREIIQYELRFYASGGPSGSTIRTVNNPDQQRYTPAQSILPSQGPVYVQVRARNSANTASFFSSEVVYAPALGTVRDVRVIDGVVLWNEPSSTGVGNINGYDLRFYASGGQSSAQILQVNSATQEGYSPAESIIPSGRPAYVQVRARNSAGRIGPWSAQVQYVPQEACPTCPQEPSPGTPGRPSNVQVLDGVVVWDRPSNTGNREITQYELRFYRRISGSLSNVITQTVTNPDQQHYRPTQLPPGGPVYVQVRATNSAGRIGPRSAEVVYDVGGCSTNNGGCAHVCTTQGSFLCSCRNGYRLSSNRRSCVEINECTEGTHNCDRECTNTEGSFRCSCTSGFTLASDGRTCNEVTTPTTQVPSCAAGCGGTLRGDSGCFNSPGWPESYPIDTDCEWIIELASTNKVIQFTYNDTVYGIAGRPPCPRDYVEIFDGLADENAPSLGRSCFRETPPPVVTSTSQSTVRFHAGPSHNPSRRGFRLTFEAVDNSRS